MPHVHKSKSIDKVALKKKSQTPKEDKLIEEFEKGLKLLFSNKDL